MVWQDGILPDGFDDSLHAILPQLNHSLTDAPGGACQLVDVIVGNVPCYVDYNSDRTVSGGAKTATYGDKYAVTICACPGGYPYDVNGLADALSYLPDFLIPFVKGE